MVSKIKYRLAEGAKAPTQHLNSGGLDLYVLEDTVIKPKSIMVVKTGLHIELPECWHALVKGRSGIDSKHFITVELGLIDNDYRGEIGIIVKNYSSIEYTFKKHTRLAQLVPFYQPNYIFRESKVLSNTERGENGFGSSGV